MTGQSDGTGKGLVEFLDYVADKGLMNKSTAQARRSAVTKVLGIDEDWESVDLRSLDLDDQTLRFETISKAELTPASLETYSSRFRSAVAEYLKYLDDPASYRPRRSQRRSSQAKRDEGSTSPRNGGRAGPDPEPQPRDDLVTYPFPLRPRTMAYLQLPPDLRPGEAERLANFVSSLAFQEQLALPAGSPDD